MKIPEYEDWIKSSHPMGWKGVLNGYPIKDIPKTKAFIIASILSILIYIISWFSSKTYGCQIIDLAETNISVFPNLLGFNLGGYAIIVGFSSLELIKSMMKPQKAKKHSLFQETSSIFAFSIVLQAIVLVSSFLIKLIDLIDLKNYLNLFDLFFKLFNVLSIFTYPILLFITIYALVLLPFIIINVFTFGQMNHAYLNIQQLNELKDKDNDAK